MHAYISIASWPSIMMEFCELIQQHELSEEDCEKPISDEHLEAISRSCCKQWKSMPPHLEMDTIEAEDIDKSKGEEREKRHKFLLKWKGIKGSKATYRQLITALLKMKCREEAEKVCKVLKESLSKLMARPLPSEDTTSSVLTIDSPPIIPSAISRLDKHLKAVYKNSPISPDGKWPPTPSREYISLALVEGDHGCRDEYIELTLKGNIKDLLDKRKKIAVEQILEAGRGENKLKLVLVEGAPGIGKSTLAWELCRKWEEFSCMQQYRLVILLRLREVEVQKIESIGELCCTCSYEFEHRKTLAKVVLESQGRDILFILDGFDELPMRLQQKGFLLNLIKGRVLPESTVLVTSRPSATGELLTSCRPQIQKHVEVLGFTQESVEAYASSILEPEKLQKFKDNTSASDNPPINSLMYIPLNAAIVIEIYRNCKSDELLPHTIAELYSQICLTILNRYLKIHNPSVPAKKFEYLHRDLPRDLYEQFFQLSKMALEATKNEEVILHEISFEHFGFLDAVPSLYGGGSISYNFLHLTVQEFFAAYHISHLDLREMEVLCEQYGKNKQWNVVWRFLAHLMKFDKFNDLYKKGLYDQLKFYFFLFQCLIGEETMVDFSSSSKTSEAAIVVFADNPTLQYAYYLGYCIAKFFSGASWDVRIKGDGLHTFMCGLQTNTPSAGVIKRLDLRRFKISFVELMTNTTPLRSITCFQVISCNLTNADMVHLSKLIPQLPCLETLVIASNRVSDGKQDGLLKVLRQLLHSNVTVLDISNTGLGKLNSTHDYSSAIKHLTSNKLKKLAIGESAAEDSNVDRLIADVLTPPLSLNEEHIYTSNLTPHVEHLINNAVHILVLFHLNIGSQVPELVDIVRHKKTLQHLTLYVFRFPEQNVDALRLLVGAIRGNKTLQSIRIHTIGLGDSHEAVSGYLAAHYEELTIDPRITWKDAYNVLTQE